MQSEKVRSSIEPCNGIGASSVHCRRSKSSVVSKTHYDGRITECNLVQGSSARGPVVLEFGSVYCLVTVNQFGRRPSSKLVESALSYIVCLAFAEYLQQRLQIDHHGRRSHSPACSCRNADKLPFFVSMQTSEDPCPTLRMLTMPSTCAIIAKKI